MFGKSKKHWDFTEKEKEILKKGLKDGEVIDRLDDRRLQNVIQDAINNFILEHGLKPTTELIARFGEIGNKLMECNNTIDEIAKDVQFSKARGNDTQINIDKLQTQIQELQENAEIADQDRKEITEQLSRQVAQHLQRLEATGLEKQAEEENISSLQTQIQKLQENNTVDNQEAIKDIEKQIKQYEKKLRSIVLEESTRQENMHELAGPLDKLQKNAEIDSQTRRVIIQNMEGQIVRDNYDLKVANERIALSSFKKNQVEKEIKSCYAELASIYEDIAPVREEFRNLQNAQNKIEGKESSKEEHPLLQIFEKIVEYLVGKIGKFQKVFKNDKEVEQRDNDKHLSSQISEVYHTITIEDIRPLLEELKNIMEEQSKEQSRDQGIDSDVLKEAGAIVKEAGTWIEMQDMSHKPTSCVQEANSNDIHADNTPGNSGKPDSIEVR